MLFKSHLRHAKKARVRSRFGRCVSALLSDSEKFLIERWGCVDYLESQDRQLQLVDRVFKGEQPETLVVCSHPPVVTLGRGTRPGDVFGWTGPIVEVSRGGRATYHGPNQIVIYPILNLEFRSRDLHLYMRALESAMVEALKLIGVNASGRTLQTQVGDEAPVESTGVWIGPRKLASIGIGVKRWISYHGLALNFDHDPEAFVGMNPCGFTSQTMTSVEEILGRPGDREKFENLLLSELQKALSTKSLGPNN